MNALNVVTDTYTSEDVTLITSVLDLLNIFHYLDERDANKACVKLVHTWFLHYVCGRLPPALTLPGHYFR